MFRRAIEHVLRLFVWSILAVLGIVGAYFIFLAGIGLSKGYGFSVMDWNGDGWTVPAEIIETSDIGDRPSPGNPGCTEYFVYKDGMPLKTACPSQEPTTD